MTEPASPSRHEEIDENGTTRHGGKHVGPFNEAILDHVRYVENIPLRGFLIDGKPALTQIDPELIGDYVLMVVRDPLRDYRSDPAEEISNRLENPVLAGRSGMFTAYSGPYKGATISVISALEGMAVLAQMDAERDAAGLPQWIPTLARDRT